MTAAEARAERAKKLRYKRPACLSLNWKGISCQLWQPVALLAKRHALRQPAQKHGMEGEGVTRR